MSSDYPSDRKKASLLSSAFPGRLISVYPCSHYSILYVLKLPPLVTKSNLCGPHPTSVATISPSSPLPTHVAITMLYLSSANPSSRQSHPCGAQQTPVVQSQHFGGPQPNRVHGGKSKGTTCVVDRDVTAYMVVDRVSRLSTE